MAASPPSAHNTSASKPCPAHRRQLIRTAASAAVLSFQKLIFTTTNRVRHGFPLEHHPRLRAAVRQGRPHDLAGVADQYPDRHRDRLAGGHAAPGRPAARSVEVAAEAAALAGQLLRRLLPWHAAVRADHADPLRGDATAGATGTRPAHHRRTGAHHQAGLWCLPLRHGRAVAQCGSLHFGNLPRRHPVHRTRPVLCRRQPGHELRPHDALRGAAAGVSPHAAAAGQRSHHAVEGFLAGLGHRPG